VGGGVVITALACTADPLLDTCLAGCKAFQLVPEVFDSMTGVARGVAAHRPGLIFTSAAFADWRQLPERFPGIRICCLVDGEPEEAPAGCEVLAASKLTVELIDARVRAPRRADPPPAATPEQAKAPPAAAPPPPQQRAPGQIPPPPPLPLQVPAPPAPTAQPQPQPQPVPPAVPVTPNTKSAAASRQPAAAPSPRTAAPASRQRSVAPVVSVLRQQVVGLWGGKPGAGRSTLALAMSDLISQMSAVRVCTVDLNPANSSLAPLLGKDQELPSWVPLADGLTQGRLNLTDALRWVRPNWAIITGPDGRDEWIAQLDPATIAMLVEGLRSQFDYILLDGEARPGPISEAVLRLAQTVLVVVSPDYPDVVDTARAFHTAVERGLADRQRCRLVLSRWLDTQHLPPDVVAECFDLPVSARIPHGYEAVITAAGQGLPVTQLDSPAAKALQPAYRSVVRLVAEQVNATAGAPDTKAAGLLGWLSR
jgi:MinD-like ATPase involved in chromosome partitioning or flagellar assembly